jgi:hypothetical protein
MNPQQIARRHFFNDCGVGVGKIALASLLTGAAGSAEAAAPAGPHAPKKPHFAPKAKRVIHLFMAGAPSHLDLFDYKPALAKHEGKPIPPEIIRGQRYAFIRSDANVLGPRFKFKKCGQSGAEIAEIMPHLAKVVDDICIVRSIHTDQFNHAPAQIFLNTGFGQPGRPSIGSWVTYGLGAETTDLPAFVVFSTGAGISGGAANWSSGFLPGVYSGVRLRNQGDPILNVSSPPGVDPKLQRDSLDVLGELNQRRLTLEGDPDIATRINSYEMAFRLQTSAPELLDLRKESKATLALYGADPDKPSFARACLLARRLIERGVRYVNLYHEGWDAHSDLAGNHKNNCAATDQGAAALIMDLKSRGMLDDTLVIWGGEFGRTVYSQGGLRPDNYGRDHHPRCFSMWLAGGGVKAGVSYGETDDFSYNIVKDAAHVRDLHATILHLFGLDHERLTFKSQGLDQRLTGVLPAKVIDGLLA